MLLFAALLCVAAAGVILESLARAGDLQRHPPPGKLLRVDGVGLHIQCMGSGGLTVVLESGLGDSSVVWAEVQRRLAVHQRVCSYDRAGIAWSAAGDAWDWQIGVQQLRALLEAAGEPPPYVLVGHSSGANYVRLFALLHPNEVAAIVLIEPPILDSVPSVMVALLKAGRTAIGGLSRVGVVRLLGKLHAMKALTGGSTPPVELDAAAGFVYGPESIRAALREIEALPETIQQVNLRSKPGALGEIPVRVVAAQPAEKAPPALMMGLQRIAQLSNRGKLVLMPGSHFLHYDHPDLIVEAILEALEAPRQ